MRPNVTLGILWLKLMCCKMGYRILQIVRGGKVSWMDKVLQICWKTFAVHSPWSKCAHVRRLCNFINRTHLLNNSE